MIRGASQTSRLFDGTRTLFSLHHSFMIFRTNKFLGKLDHSEISQFEMYLLKKYKTYWTTNVRYFWNICSSDDVNIKIPSNFKISRSQRAFITTQRCRTLHIFNTCKSRKLWGVNKEWVSFYQVKWLRYYLVNNPQIMSIYI